MRRIGNYWFVLVCLCTIGTARADIALLLEEPYGMFGGMNPTGHAAIYFSRICAETPVMLRECRPGEMGVVISRYHRVGGYDWLAIPVVPYLYAVEQPSEVPTEVNAAEVAALRDAYRRAHLSTIAPDDDDGSTPDGDWTQLVGEAYDRTIYAFRIETSREKDQQLIHILNSVPNQVRFNLLFQNCADFSKHIVNFYFPGAIRRNISADLGIMTPEQATRRLLRFSAKHSDLQFSSAIIGQVPGSIPRSRRVRGVLESLIKSKRYLVPLAAVALLHPVAGGGLAYVWMKGSSFHPERGASLIVRPQEIAEALGAEAQPAPSAQ